MDSPLTVPHCEPTGQQPAVPHVLPLGQLHVSGVVELL
jgi:hypothetical protein